MKKPNDYLQKKITPSKYEFTQEFPNSFLPKKDFNNYGLYGKTLNNTKLQNTFLDPSDNQSTKRKFSDTNVKQIEAKITG